MQIDLDIRKSIEENASDYFERAKKSKKKLEGARKVIWEHRDKLNVAREASELTEKKTAQKRKQDWFEKFRWFISSDGFLVIGGRDATTNEIIIKKHTLPEDIVFHTDMAGSPFVIIKQDGKGEIPKETLEEAAIFTAVFSRGWKNSMATLPVFCVKPEQVSKTPNPGESLAKGAFVIRGETRYFSPKMEYALGIQGERIMGGPPSAVKKHCPAMVMISQGDSKTSEIAKAIRKKLGGELDEIIRALPPGSKLNKAQAN
jgi:predicted ribosome quality control (RQC) complex YloA/Tae2 family protein